MIPCQFFVLGQCWSGSSCRFSHDPAVARPGGSNRPCHEFSSKGICRYGGSCVFVHRAAVAPGSQLEFQAEEPKAYYYGDQPELVGVYGEAPVDMRGGASSMLTEETPKGTSWAKVARLPHQQIAETNRNNPVPVQEPKSTSSSQVEKVVPLTSDKRPLKVPCKFFFSEKGCRSGAECRFSHLAEERALADDESGSKCGICLESLRFKRLGMLTDCEHVFCLACIKNWRSSELSESDASKATTQSCPTCRVRSAFVVPIDQLPRSMEEKKAAINAFKQKCARVPCKYGDDSCPFGTSCLYFHEAYDPAKLNLKFVKGADGKDRAMASTIGKLSDMILQ